MLGTWNCGSSREVGPGRRLAVAFQWEVPTRGKRKAMAHKYVVDDLAGFVVGAEQADLSERPRALLKRNVLDSIACAVGSLDGELIATIREHTDQFSGVPTATLVGGGRASVDQAGFFNSVLVRYPDLLDTYLTVGGLCHPADNFAAVLAVAEHVNASGADFLLALAVAYEIQCRFSAQVPVMAGAQSCTAAGDVGCRRIGEAARARRRTHR